MTREEMLKKLRLTEAEYTDLISQFLKFTGNLDEAQKRVVRHNMPKLEKAARSFGPDVTVEDFKKFCGPVLLADGWGCWGGEDE